MKKMGQIVKRKKKGRPSKADLAKRREESSAPERELRRSHRQRSVRYTFDFDDYLEEDELFEGFDDDAEDERRREKKLKLLFKLQGSGEETIPTLSTTPSQAARRVLHAPAASQSSSDYGGGDGGKPSKKRKMDSSGALDDEGDDEDEDENADADTDEHENVEDDEVDRGGQAEHKGEADSVPGTPPSGLPLPDKKTLELILDKLQKKDIYGVYAEPVDPEELPDYHEVIDYPMDFATVRNKLGSGSYATLEQFESDVFLICSNAMQYNAPDTVYYKQARSIQELAKKKFEKVRFGIERPEELKSEQMTKLSSVVKKQMKKPVSRTLQEGVGSDFSSGATLATARDFLNGSSVPQSVGSERAGSVDRLLEGTSLVDNNIDKVEESLLGKRPLSKVERKLILNEENRRATYNISTEAVASSDSVLSTFEGESKQLISVGLGVDHSYARSLARFAATLGTVAWRIASKRIEQSLPPGFKFGRGWVGEYEPLPTSVLKLENCTVKEPPFFMKIEQSIDARKGHKMPAKLVSSKQNALSEPRSERLRKSARPFKEGGEQALDRISAFYGSGVIKPTATSSPNVSLPCKEKVVRVASSEGRPSLFCSPANKTTLSASPSSEQQSSKPRNVIEPQKKVVKQVELNCSPSGSQTADFMVERQVLNSSEVSASRTTEVVSKNTKLLPSGSSKQSNLNGVPGGGLVNGKVNYSDSNKMSVSSPDVAKAVSYFPRVQERSLTDPVQLMRLLTERAQNQLNSSTHPPVDSSPIASPTLSSKKDDSGSAAAAAARAWMSVGAGGFKPAGENTSSNKNQISAESLYNSVRDLHPQVSRFHGEHPPYGMHFQPERNGFAFHPFVPQPTRMGNDAQFQNRPVVFPQLVTTDLSRFQVQSPWQPLSPQMQPRQKQESLPPDLNISFQASGSPGRPASSVLVDSQQPDLALQL